MMNDTTFRGSAAWAAVAPLLCAVHCVAMPLLAVLVPALAPLGAAEGVLMVLAGGAVAVVLARGTRLHGRLLPWIPAAAGSAVWVVSVTEVVSHVPEEVGAVAGSALLAAGAMWNWRLLVRPSGDCACPACE